MHSLKLVSNAWQPAVLCPEEAQQAMESISNVLKTVHGNSLKTEAMIVRHGFAFDSFGRRTRNFGSGGRRTAATFVEAPLGGIFHAD